MRSSIDSAGRITIPRRLRDELGWSGRHEVEIAVVDGSVMLSPVAAKMTLIETEHGVVAVPEPELPPLTVDIVQRTRDSLRR